MRLAPYLLAGHATSLKLVHRGGGSCDATPEWPGWSGIKYAFTFGDSYTTTSFDPSLAPPSASNPLGNPPYPGWTSANGTNWVGFLTTKYNSSVLQTYNLATGGATVDEALVPTFGIRSLSLKQQVAEVFLPVYAPAGRAPAAPAWEGGNAVFALWIGINDVGNSYYIGDEARRALNEQIFAGYAQVVTQLYQAGARNFVFVNVPPVHRSPFTSSRGRGAQELEEKAILAFNDDVGVLAKDRVKSAMQGVNVWVLDAYALFGQVLDDPARYAATKGYRNLTDFCEAYQSGTPAADTFNVTCGVPVDQYFWLNSLHPTSPMHDVVAEQLAKALDAGPNVCNLRSMARPGRITGELWCPLRIFAFLAAVLLPWRY